MQSTTAERQEPGLTIGIVYDQQLVWAKGYGYADLASRTSATPTTLYGIASISKLFTATAILQLRDAGKLRLDDPVSSHLPWLHVREPQPDSPAITIEQLLTHTSGLPRELPLPYWNDLRFPTSEHMVALLGDEQAIFAPENARKYSNLGFAVAGELVPALAGGTYERYVQGRILEPLRMRATLAVPDRATPGLAAGYRRRAAAEPREKEDFIDARALTASAGFASNVEDLARFVSLQFRDGPAGGAQILKGATLREMHRLHWIDPDWPSGMGLAWELRRAGGLVRVGKAGTASGYQSRIDIDPAARFGVIVLANGYDTDPALYSNQAFAILAPAIARAIAVPEPAHSADPAWSRYVGTYTWKHADAQVLIANGELIMIVPDAANPWESRVRLTPAGRDTFLMHGGGNDGELLKFEVDAGGAVTNLTAGSYYRIRKP
jgi:CubicO group peptidase (beta-lactamase class C family)